MSEKTIERVAVIGAGTLGAQITMLAANANYSVKIFDVRPNALDSTLKSVKGIESLVPKKRWPAILEKVRPAATLEEAVADVQLVVEAVPEQIGLKNEVWAELGRCAHPDAILATNSSSIPVSKMEAAGGRPDKSLNIHFYLGMPMADVMGGSQTLPEVIEAGKHWVRTLNLLPLSVKKELLGFCFNRVWRAVKREVLWMWAEGYVDFMDVDRAWMVFNGMQGSESAFGPFALMDKVGLDVIWDIEMVYYRESGDPKDHPPQALRDKIASGELGVKTGKGFYEYPNPAYLDPDFLNSEKN
ncbi:MAG: 3-hydroxyacyl-CoA dehydrogenase family protein [bacterium]|nr:3-hydroxyacyl-CoA dehydrogenase family protein [bacterium]